MSFTVQCSLNDRFVNINNTSSARTELVQNDTLAEKGGEIKKTWYNYHYIN